MDRSRRRATGRALVGLVVAVALYGGLATVGLLDSRAGGDGSGAGLRHAAIVEHAAALTTVLPARGGDRLSTPRWREKVAIAVGVFAFGFALATRRRVRARPLRLQSSFVGLGAARAPPHLQLRP